MPLHMQALCRALAAYRARASLQKQPNLCSCIPMRASMPACDQRPSLKASFTIMSIQEFVSVNQAESQSRGSARCWFEAVSNRV